MNFKHLFAAAGVILAAASCTESEDLLTTPQGEIVTAILSTQNDDTQSRVSVTPDSSAWYVQWNKGDVIGAWSAATQQFPLEMTDMTSATSATFSGVNNSGVEFVDNDACYVYPYREGSIADGKLTLDVSEQLCDMATLNYHLSDNSYMVSALGRKSLSNLVSMFELQINFTYGTITDSGNSQLYQVVFKGDAVRSRGEYDLAEGTYSYDEPATGTADSITINIVNSPMLKQKDTNDYIVRFTSLPFMLTEGESVDIDLYIHHMGKNERKVYRAGISTTDTKHIVAGFYNTIDKNLKLVDCVSWIDDKYIEPDVEDTKYSGGEGTEDNPYLLSNATDLTTLSNSSAAGEYYKLSCDIETTQNLAAFNGTLDGNFKTITHTASGSGLFAEITAGSVVKNLKLHHNHTFLEKSGCLTTLNSGVIDNCYILPSDVTSKYSITAAGVCKGNTGLIVNTVSAVNILGEKKAAISGFVAYNSALTTSGYVVNCVNLGDLKGSANVGGFIGQHNDGAEMYLYNCYSAGEITANSEFGEIAGKSTKNSGEWIYSLGRYTKKITGEQVVTSFTTTEFINTLNGNIESLSAKIDPSYADITFNEWTAAENGYPIPFVEQQQSVGGDVPSTDLNWADEASMNYGGGLGTEASPYIISSVYELARLISCGSSECHYKLMEELDLTNGNWSAVDSGVATNFNYNGKGIVGIHTTTENLSSIFAE